MVVPPGVPTAAGVPVVIGGDSRAAGSVGVPTGLPSDVAPGAAGDADGDEVAGAVDVATVAVVATAGAADGDGEGSVGPAP